MTIKAGTGAAWLADQTRDWGIPFRTVPGWQTRGMPGLDPWCVVCHHIGLGGTDDAPGLGVVTHGRAGLRNSLANDHLARSGMVSIVAAGVCWHAGSGGWAGFTGNPKALGIEAEGTTGQSLTGAQAEIYPELVACRLDGIRRYHHPHVDELLACQHGEWAKGRKADCWALMRDPVGFRINVGRLLALKEDDMFTDEDRKLLREVRAALLEGAPKYGVPPMQKAVTEIGYNVAGVDLDGKPSRIRQLLVKAGIKP